MRIGILGIKGVPGHHGVEVVVDSLLPHLISLGHDITVYGYESYAQPTDDYLGGRVTPVSGSSRKNLEMITHMWNASRDARRRDFDLVHIHSADPCLLAWLPRSRYGVVATSHGRAYLRKKWGFAAQSMSRLAERFFIYLPKVITSVSKPLCDYYESKYHRDVVYIPNGINIQEKPDHEVLKKWGLEPERFLFCSSGRIERTKGLTTLLDAYRKAEVDMPLIIAGGGSATDLNYFNELKANKPDGVTFVGFLTGDELYSLYAYARVFIFPSEYEAMSMALLEGLSFGVPTLYSNIPENTVVAEGLGHAFQVSDVDSLADRLHHVLNHYDDALALGRKAREFVEKNHDWAAIANRYHEIYTKLSGG
jgi:glycosyltransferase involved in cell wall biosynthesis